MAPEVLKEGIIARRNDIWSLGCTLIELSTGKHPWSDVTDITELFKKIEKQELPNIPSHLSQKCKDFIKRCLIYDKKSRP